MCQFNHYICPSFQSVITELQTSAAPMNASIDAWHSAIMNGEGGIREEREVS